MEKKKETARNGGVRCAAALKKLSSIKEKKKT